MRSFILTQQPIYQTPLTDTCSSRKAGLGVRTITRAVQGNTPPSLSLTKRHYWTKFDGTP